MSNTTIKSRWRYDHVAARSGHYGGKAPRKSKKQMKKREGIHYWFPAESVKVEVTK